MERTCVVSVAAVASAFTVSEQPLFNLSISPTPNGREHKISAVLVHRDGRGSPRRLASLRLNGSMEGQVQYKLEPLEQGEYSIVFTVSIRNEESGLVKSVSSSPTQFEVEESSLSELGVSQYGVLPGASAFLADEELLRGNVDRGIALACDALRRRPLDQHAWRIYSKLHKTRNNHSLAYETLKLAINLNQDAASLKDRATLLDLAIDRDWKKSPQREFSRTQRPLQIVFAAPYLDPPVGGAELTWLYLATAAQEQGHKVSIITSGQSSRDLTNAIPTRRYQTASLALRDAALKDADVIVTQNDWASEFIDLANTLGCPSIVFVQSYELLCRRPWMLQDCESAGSGCYCDEASLPSTRARLQRASLVYVASTDQAKHVERLSGVKAEVFHQLIDPATVIPHTEWPFKAIVMNQPDFHKGGLIVEELARRLPDETFVTVGYANRPLRRARNLHHLGKVEPALLYAIADILLVPSIWPEPFGRVALEAQIAGVPVIASRRGALPYVLGADALLVDDPHDVDAWLTHILALKSDEEFRRSQIARGHGQALKFDAQLEVARLIRSFEEVVKRSR